VLQQAPAVERSYFRLQKTATPSDCLAEFSGGGGGGGIWTKHDT
jgi:hypothetical protein